MDVFLILVGLAFLFALLSLIPQTSSYPLLGIAVLFVTIALFINHSGRS